MTQMPLTILFAVWMIVIFALYLGQFFVLLFPSLDSVFKLF